LDFALSAIGSSQGVRPAPHMSVAVRLRKSWHQVRTHGTVELKEGARRSETAAGRRPYMARKALVSAPAAMHFAARRMAIWVGLARGKSG